MSDALSGVGFTTTGNGTVVVAEFGEPGAWLEIDDSAVVARRDWTPCAAGDDDE